MRKIEKTISKMKYLFVILAIFASGPAFAQNKVEAGQGVIELTPDKVQIPSTGEYVYLAKIVVIKDGKRQYTGEYAFFVSKNAGLYERFSKKGMDSIAILEGAKFKPLQHYTKKQWRKLSKEIKKFFPLIGQQELEKMDFYLLFNSGVEPKEQPVPKPIQTTTPKTGTGKLPE